jgi:peptidoglycan hydrolase-like protein with peptidoglycan-binding domain
MQTKILLAGLGVALIAVPFISSAASVSDLQTEVASLLSQMQALQVQGNTSSSVSVSGSVSSPSMPACPLFGRSLSFGSTGSDVTALQQFLASKGYLNVSATGYFGALTKAAVGKWQVQSGITTSASAGFGVFGPLSRSYFLKNCGSSQGGGTTTTNGSVSFTASPISGQFPLTVQFIATAPQGTTLGNTVNFGDGTSGTLGFVPVCSSCNAEGTVTHVYQSAGTYTATLTSGMCSCPANGICNCPNMMIIATTTVTVGSTSTASNIQQLNAPGSVTLQTNWIAEIRNESFYFTLESLTASTATIQLTPVGCWNSFPSDPPPKVVCMLAMLPIPPQTLSIGQAYDNANYGITLTSISNSSATFSITASSAPTVTAY